MSETDKHSASTSDAPRVSVMMGVYNSSRYLRKAIDSVLAQTFRDFELVIINDGSTDESEEIVRSYDDPRIRYVLNETNIGIIPTRNKALALCRGEYLAILDSDDISMPERLARQVEFLDTHQDYGMCGTYFRTIDEDDNLMYDVNFPTEEKAIKSQLFFGNCFCHSTVMVRTAMAKEHGYPFKSPLGEDYQMWIDLSTRTKMSTLPEYLSLYRVHKKNTSHQQKETMYESVKLIQAGNLTNLGVTFSPAELDIHAKMLVYHQEHFKDREQFRLLENWLDKVGKVVKARPDLDKKVIFQLLAHRWIILCYKYNRKLLIVHNRFVHRLDRYFLRQLFVELRNHWHGEGPGMPRTDW